MKVKKIWILTMFDQYFDAFKEYGVISKALNNERSSSISFELIPVSIPKYCKKGFKGVDSAPYGGGAGMVMRADALKEALENGVLSPGGYKTKDDLHIVYPAPRGKTWNNERCKAFAKANFSLDSDKDLVFICGRYEGVDERFLDNYVDEYISIGNFILTGGELAVMMILDSSLRFVDEILGNKLSAIDESFSTNQIEYPLYTRPMSFEGVTPPDTLTGGNHKKIEELRESQKNEMTKKYREDLIK